MKHIEEARKEKNISVAELCKRIQVNRTTYYKWLDGTRTPKIKKVKGMCDVLELEFAKIVDNFL